MKTYKNIKLLENRFKKANGLARLNNLLWDDEGIKVNNRIYKLAEYGGGAIMNMDYDYMLFENKTTDTTIKIKYDCPSWQGSKLIKAFKFIDVEVY